MKNFINYCKNHFKYKTFKYILYIILFLIISFIFRTSDVNAASESNIAGYHVGDEFSIGPGQTLERRSYVITPSNSVKNNILVEICSTAGDGIGSWNGNVGSGYVGNENQVFNTGQKCGVSNYEGDVIFLIIKVSEWTDAGNGNYGVIFSTAIKNQVGWNGIFRLTAIVLTDDPDVTIAMYGQNKTIINQNDTVINQNQQQINQNQTIIDQNNQTNEKLDGINDSIKDGNIDGATSGAGDFFSGFTTDTFGLTSIITAPLNLIGSITSSTCSPLGLQLPFVNQTMNLPCMRSIYEENFGSFYDIYTTITFGVIAYWVCVRIFALVKDFKNPDHDEIEVMDL